MSRPLQSVVAVIGLMVAIPASAAGPAASVALPGGVAAARVITEVGGADRAAAAFLIDLTRALHGTPNRDRRGTAERFVAYLDYLDRLRQDLAPFADGLSIAGIERDRKRRNALADVLDRLGLRLDRKKDAFVVSVDTGDDARSRAEWLRAIGADVNDLAARLSKGETVRLTWPVDDLPLPCPEAWSALFGTAAPPPLQRLLTDANALLFYFGLANLDSATAAWLATQPELIRNLHGDLPGSFAAFGRSVRVSDGRVRVPGPASDALWEDLVEAPVTDPARFVRRLLDRDGGRLAYFYDAVAMLDPARQSLLTGAHLDARLRREYVHDVYRRFAGVEPTWKTAELPFMRPTFEPGFAIAVVDLMPDGLIAPAWWPAMLERAAQMSWPDRVQTRALPARQADAVWLLDFLFDVPEQARTRFQLLRFAQRAFAAAPESASPAMTVALVSLRDRQALPLALERIGVRDPDTYAAAALAAGRLTAGGAGDAAAAVRGWQGGLAVIEQVSRFRPVPASIADALTRSLADATPEHPSTPNGKLAVWTLDRLLPALGVPTDVADLAEPDAIDRMLAREGAPSDVTFEWEQLPYRLDLAGSAGRFAAEIRATMPGPRIQDLIVLREAAGRLARPFASVDELRALTDRLRPLTAVVADVRAIDGAPVDAARDLAKAIEDLDDIRDARQLTRAARAERAVLAALDASAPEVLAGLASALALSPGAATPRVYGEAARDHSFDAADPDGLWRDRAWTVASRRSRQGGGIRYVGSLLGLDLARASELLRQTEVDNDRPRASLSDVDARTLSERAALRSPDTDWRRAGTRIAAAIARGRSIAGGWTVATDRAGLEQALAAASIDAWRATLVRFLLDANRSTEIPGLLSVTDLYRLGSPDPVDAAWGSSSAGIDGCWCLFRPARQVDDFWLNRRMSYAGAISLDLQLRLTELLQTMSLPHALLEYLLPLAEQDLIDHSAQVVADDRDALASWPRRLGADRIEIYLLDLVARRVLTAPRSGSGSR